MGTLFIDRSGLNVRLDGQALSFYFNGERQGTAPVNPLKRVVVVGNAEVSASALHKLADMGIHVLFLGGKGHRFKGIFRGRLHNNAILRVRQYQKSLLPFANQTAREIVLRKIKGQHGLLETALDQRPDLRKPLFDAAKTLDEICRKIGEKPQIEKPSLMGMEGGAAAAYFAAYTQLFAPSLMFVKREKRPPKDPVNALLSLSYTMLHFETVREIEMIGLDPFIGFFHEFDYGRESLACDMVEMFRPVVDQWVWDLFRKREFTGSDFTEGEERAGCYLKKDGRKKYYLLYEEFMNGVRPDIVGEVRALARRIMDGEDAVLE